MPPRCLRQPLSPREPGATPTGTAHPSCSQRGASALELALVLPVITVLLLGIVEFGYAFFVQAAVAGAARTGVRSYAINYARPNAQSLAASAARSAVPDDAGFVSATLSGTCAAGAQTSLTVVYRYQTLTGLFDGFLSSNLTITGKGSMQCGG